jgi:hypothetical protein
MFLDDFGIGEGRTSATVSWIFWTAAAQECLSRDVERYRRDEIRGLFNRLDAKCDLVKHHGHIDGADLGLPIVVEKYVAAGCNRAAACFELPLLPTMSNTSQYLYKVLVHWDPFNLGPENVMKYCTEIEQRVKSSQAK